ncbi:MAG: cyclic nucleotide-binding domain-containing protein [Polyangiales bacterium]
MVPTKPGDRRTHLQRVKLLRGLDAFTLDMMLPCLRWRALAAGEVLFREGDPGDTMVFLTAGEVRVSVRHVDGDEVTVATGLLGDSLGEMVCIDPAPRAATVVATVPSVVAELSRDGLAALESAMPHLSARIISEVIHTVTQRMRALEARIDQELGVAPTAPARSAPPPAQPERRGALMAFIDRLRGGV